jgi:hypothetical protein
MPETEAEHAAAKKIQKAWEVWYGELGDALVDGGGPFAPLAKTIASDGSVSDGPVGVMAIGYTIIKADSLDEAVEKAKGCPGYIGSGDVTVYETFQVM